MSNALNNSMTKDGTGLAEADDVQTAFGGHVLPGSWMVPAETESASAHTSRQEANSLLTVDSPIEEIHGGRGGFASAKTGHSTTQADEDLSLFRSLTAREDFARLTDLCRERLLLAPPSSPVWFRWQKDFSIVKSLQGKFGEALDLLTGAHSLAPSMPAGLRARYRDEFGLVYVEFGRPLLALEQFDLAHEAHESAGNLAGVGIVENNKAVALELLGEYRQAELTARLALSTLSAHGDPAAISECFETWKALDRKLRAR